MLCELRAVDLSDGIRTPRPTPNRTWTTDPNNLIITTGLLGDFPEINEEFFSGGFRQLLLPGVLRGPPNFSLFSGGLEFSTHVFSNLTDSAILPELQDRHSESIRDLIFDEILGTYTCLVENEYGSDVATTVISECSEY